MTEHILDVRSETPSRRHGLVLDTCRALRIGEGFVLANDLDLKPLRHQLEVEQAGAYGWDYLEQGPEVWRVRIGRLPGSR